VADKVKLTRQGALAEMISAHGWSRGVELGVWQGATLGYLLARFPALRMYGVDNWAPVGPYAGKDMAAAEAAARVIERRYPDRCVLIKEDTVKAASRLFDRQFDFVFIDASHDTESVVQDIRAWRSKLLEGGKLCGHDADWSTVRAALEAELGTWQEIGGNVWIAT
jgi:predicted O-methyltransferase YrrM